MIHSSYNAQSCLDSNHDSARYTGFKQFLDEIGDLAYQSCDNILRDYFCGCQSSIRARFGRRMRPTRPQRRVPQLQTAVTVWVFIDAFLWGLSPPLFLSDLERTCFSFCPLLFNGVPPGARDASIFFYVALGDLGILRLGGRDPRWETGMPHVGSIHEQREEALLAEMTRGMPQVQGSATAISSRANCLRSRATIVARGSILEGKDSWLQFCKELNVHPIRLHKQILLAERD